MRIVKTFEHLEKLARERRSVVYEVSWGVRFVRPAAWVMQLSAPILFRYLRGGMSVYPKTKKSFRKRYHSKGQEAHGADLPDRSLDL